MLRWGADVRMGMIRVNAVKKNGAHIPFTRKGKLSPKYLGKCELPKKIK